MSRSSCLHRLCQLTPDVSTAGSAVIGTQHAAVDAKLGVAMTAADLELLRCCCFQVLLELSESDHIALLNLLS